MQTPFVRQNTPHPKDLKAKAHKLLAGRSPEAVVQTTELPKVQTPTTNGLPLSPVEAVPTPMEVIEVSSLVYHIFICHGFYAVCLKTNYKLLVI